MTAPIEAVTFDHWNTLVHEDNRVLRSSRLDAWIGVLEGEGFPVERQRLDAAFASSWERFVKSWEAGERYTHVEAAVDILDELGYDVPPDVHDQLVQGFAVGGDQRALQLCDHVPETLRALKDAGVRLGIVCDVGMTPSTALRANLERCGVLDLFDHWSFSDEVGAYKPSPVIFQHALDGLGARPDRVAHVGDLRRTDVAGAKDMGMIAVRYNGVFDDAGDGAADLPDGDHVLDDHRLLPAALGIS